IGGWFFTALAAFTAAGTVAYLIHLGGPVMVAVFLLLAILLLIRNYVKHLGKSREAKTEDSLSKAESSSIHGVIEESADNVSKALKRVGKITSMTVNGLVDRDLDKLKKAKHNVNKLETEIEDLQNDIFYFIKDLDDSYLGASKFYIDTIGSLQDIAQSSSLIAKVSYKHVNNHHKKLKNRESEELLQITSTLEALLARISEIFDSRDFGKIVPEIIEEKKALLSEVHSAIQTQVERTREKESTSPKNTTLYFIILIETKDLMQACIDVLNLYYAEHDREQSQ
ncbi:MAG: inorganic phosphate transporter, partial [Lutimonas sp.]